MNNKKAAVFSCKGLGDGLISLTLANNLFINGFKVDTYHPKKLYQLQNWFLDLKILPFPKDDKIDELINSYDIIFVSYDTSSFISKLIEKGKQKNNLIVLNPSPSKKIGSQPYYKDAYFDPTINMPENIERFCKAVLHLDKYVNVNNIRPLQHLIYNKNKDRVIIHPTSAKEGKNWPKIKYVKLAEYFKRINKNPVFVMSTEEKKGWIDIENRGYEVKAFDDLSDLASYIYESYAMIGNDSGIGHLASSLKIPTVTIFRNYRSSCLWRPGFYKNISIYPSRYIPNISSFRLRDKYWKKFISVKKVVKSCNLMNF